MAFKVTIGESKTQEVKPFPKLMTYKYPNNGAKILLLMKDSKNGVVLEKLEEGININMDALGNFWTIISDDSNIGVFTDYNEPITLQNR